LLLRLKLMVVMATVVLLMVLTIRVQGMAAAGQRRGVLHVCHAARCSRLWGGTRWRHHHGGGRLRH
jgi:hypothetical protein